MMCICTDESEKTKGNLSRLYTKQNLEENTLEV